MAGIFVLEEESEFLTFTKFNNKQQNTQLMKKIVVIGGGTGAFTVLRGLKHYTNRLAAIVSMFDSGGSTGRLRDEFGFLPPGDVRRCILALAPETEKTKILRELLSYRFSKGEGLNKHNFGNLWLTALRDVIGNELGAIDYLSNLFNISGRVLPVTLDNSHLCAEFTDGTIVKGETNIDIPKHDGSLRISRLFLEPPAHALAASLDAVEDADLVVIGPGDLYTSLMPNFLVTGMKEALAATSAKKVFVCNVMTKWGETHGFTASDFLREVQKYAGAVNAMVVNTKNASHTLLERYNQENAFPVLVDRENIKTELIEADLLNEQEIVRHDSYKLAKVLIGL